MMYEVAVVDNEEERRVLARNVPKEELWACIAAAFEEEPRGAGARAIGVLVSRMDSLPPTWTERVQMLVDVAEGRDKYGRPTTRRSFRYGKIDKKNKKTGVIKSGKLSMEDWDLLMKLNSWRPRRKKVERIDAWAGTQNCKNDDELCSCLILGTRCRLEPGQKVLASSIREA